MFRKRGRPRLSESSSSAVNERRQIARDRAQRYREQQKTPKTNVHSTAAQLQLQRGDEIGNLTMTPDEGAATTPAQLGQPEQDIALAEHIAEAQTLDVSVDKSTARGSTRGILTGQDHNVRPSKRVRLSEGAVAAISTQCAQADTSLEVDHMILDYMAYRTIQSCLSSRHTDQSNSSHCSLSSTLTLFNAFFSIFKTRHPTYEADPELHIRILLVKFTTLFTQRFTSNPTTPTRSALVDLRAVNKVRARTWIESSDFLPSSSLNMNVLDNDLPLSERALERNRAHVLHKLDVPPEDSQYEDAFYGTSSSVSLLDILEDFMELSAMRNSMSGSTLTHQWMQLACEFMMQACLEQYLVFGAEGSDTVDEAFSWGYGRPKDDPMNVDGAFQEAEREICAEISTMFEDEEYYVEVDGWTDMRKAYIEQLVSPDADSSSLDASGQTLGIVTHLQRLMTERPIANFEAKILKFLEAIAKSIPEPVLIQLAQGKLDGMTEQETREFLKDCGGEAASFFNAPVGFKTAVN